jgi:hypothetical protein
MLRSVGQQVHVFFLTRYKTTLIKRISGWPQPGFRRAEFSNFFGNGDSNFDNSDDRVRYKRVSLNNSVYVTS